MIQRPFHSTIEAQPRNVTFLTIKTVVKKIPKKKGRSGGLMCLAKAMLGRGGGGGVSWVAGLCSWFCCLVIHAKAF